MMRLQHLKSPDGNSEVSIDQGELISYQFHGEELIHQKGDPGWRNADTEMFPVIGPTASNKFVVHTPKGDAIQDQHGLLRELSYTLVSQNVNKAVYHKEYAANTPVKNSKYPDKSNREEVYWPYGFQFKKGYQLNNINLSIQFEIIAQPGMPYMLGYHPAFKLTNEGSEMIKAGEIELTLQDVLDVGSIAYPVRNSNRIRLLKRSGHHILIETKGFGHFMLWTEVPNMICIEPISAYPYNGQKALSTELFNICRGKDKFEVMLSPYQ